MAEKETCVIPYYENEWGKLYCGDCIEIMERLTLENGNGWTDMVLCDPPYGTTVNKWDSVVDLDSMWLTVWSSAKENAAVVMTSAVPFTAILGASSIEQLRYSWVWEKSRATGHLNAKRMPMKNHEDVLVFYRKQPTYNPQGLQPYGKITKRGNNGGCYNDSGRENMQEHTGYPRTVQPFKCVGKTSHPTQKPVDMFAYFIRTYTNVGDVVLDFCAGSGTTALAAQQERRKWVLIEKQERYCDLVVERLKCA